MRHLEDVVPDWVARNQRYWERRQQMLRFRLTGATLKETAARFGVSIEGARALLIKAERSRSKPPIVTFIDRTIGDDLLDTRFGDLLRRHKKYPSRLADCTMIGLSLSHWGIIAMCAGDRNAVARQIVENEMAVKAARKRKRFKDYN